MLTLPDIIRRTLKQIYRGPLHPILHPLVRPLEEPLKRMLRTREDRMREETNRHRPYTSLNAIPALTQGTQADDWGMVERLLKAYRRVSPETVYGADTMWGEFFETHHRELHDVFISGHVENARAILSNPASNNLFYGFDNLCASMMRLHTKAKNIHGHALNSQDNLIRLAEAIGAYRVDNPHIRDQWLFHARTSTDDVLDAVENRLGTKISFPDIFAKAIGAQSKRGVITYRALQGVYLAFRLREWLRSGCIRFSDELGICEIGAGLGYSALYAHALGMKNYTLVDIPMTAISQGYFLMRCLGEDAVVLPGEARLKADQIQILHTEDFFEGDENYSLVANMDSITEFGEEMASKVMMRIANVTSAFLSINNENNVPRVQELALELPAPSRILRFPYWMRTGYVEELVLMAPPTDGV